MAAVPYPRVSIPVVDGRRPFTLFSLIDGVREAVGRDSLAERVSGVRRVLENAVCNHPGFLPASFLESGRESYARREIHTDPEGKFSILAMVWTSEQGTQLHDHGGNWVVECVYAGRVRVCNYEYLGEQNGLHQFVATEERFDGPGISDMRVPPAEHHVLQNACPFPSVTLHVFGGILEHCNTFVPVPGGYERVPKTMVAD